MKPHFPLPKHKKLTVIFRVEAGSLGPNGAEHLQDFCEYAQKTLKTDHSDYADLEVVARSDKQLPEIEYLINNKRLKPTQAARYLHVFAQELEDFEGDLISEISHLIGHYLDH